MRFLFSVRFIPTGVGNGGQHLRLLAKIGGSSPRVWGTVMQLISQRLLARFIPTGVGNGLSRPDSVAFLSVHPHGCGERPRDATRLSPLAGSSPRVWGTEMQEGRSIHQCRFIPTGVGNGAYK